METAAINDMDPCVFHDVKGRPYREFSCMYPLVSSVYFDYERSYDPDGVIVFMKMIYWFPWAAVTLYGLLITVGQKYMNNRDPWNWRLSMAMWNLGLSLFSWIGAFKTMPHLIHNLATMPFRDNLCVDPRYSYGSGSTGLWCLLFVCSKFPELFDTFFIIIHKKKLIFLHWYHHITVLLYCWFSFVSASPPSIFFVSMNYVVHAFMYGYYFLMTRKLVPTWFNPMIITVLQISQMILGVFITLSGFHYYRTDPDCGISSGNMVAAFVMYGSYLFLFLQFFVLRYVFKGGKDKAKAKKL